MRWLRIAAVVLFGFTLAPVGCGGNGGEEDLTPEEEAQMEAEAAEMGAQHGSQRFTPKEQEEGAEDQAGQGDSSP